MQFFIILEAKQPTSGFPQMFTIFLNIFPESSHSLELAFCLDLQSAIPFSLDGIHDAVIVVPCRCKNSQILFAMLARATDFVPPFRIR